MSDKNTETEIPEIGPNGELPEGWEYPEDLDDSTITSKRVSEAIMSGDSFVPQNPAEQELKEEIAEVIKEGGLIEVPSDE